MNDDAAVTTVFVDERATKLQLQRSKVAVVEGADCGQEVIIEREKISVGRSPICDLVLSDPAVSSVHFEIVASDQGFLLRDLDSTNGLYCGELRVQEAWITPGTVLRVGQTHMRFDAVEGTVDIDLSRNEEFYGLVGQSIRMREIFAILQRIATTDLTVLISGETGTGKELAARALMSASKRADKPFVVQDCGTIPRDLIESTLFGHERGAFTGARERQRGSFEQAHTGTIFLDEIGELDIALQPKLLRVLESREIRRVGGQQTIPVDLRVVAATNRDLREMVNEGTFREDLYYRLGVVHIHLPPLRERLDDISLVAQSVVDRIAEQRYPGEGKRYEITPEAMKKLRAHPWPGNVRELKNALERAVSMLDGFTVTAADVLPGLSPATAGYGDPPLAASQYVDAGTPFKTAKQELLESFEAAYLRALLARYGGNITRSAEAAGLTRYHLRELAKRFGIQ